VTNLAACAIDPEVPSAERRVRCSHLAAERRRQAGPNQKALRDQLRAPKQTRHRVWGSKWAKRPAAAPHRRALFVCCDPHPHIEHQPKRSLLYFRIVKRTDPPSRGVRSRLPRVRLGPRPTCFACFCVLILFWQRLSFALLLFMQLAHNIIQCCAPKLIYLFFVSFFRYFLGHFQCRFGNYIER
jgi:hypothetical protein